MTKAEDFGHLPAELDNETVVFSYGSLLEHEKLQELFKIRGEFKVLETDNMAEAVKLVKSNPSDIVILLGVRLENVRVSIVTETILRRWYKNRGGDIEALIDSGVTTPEIPPCLFLYARPAKPSEAGKTLNGGLICNLSRAELSRLDKYEWEPVLKRVRTPELKIGEHTFIPEFITFYAGTESIDDITTEEKAERARLLYLNRKAGHLSPQAKWRKNVRRR
jgi:hypothetical protein